MKKLLLFLFSAFAFAACEQAPIEEAHGVADSNRNLSVSFEGDDTRIQLNEAQKTVLAQPTAHASRRTKELPHRPFVVCAVLPISM